jgi:hypothetical protein
MKNEFFHSKKNYHIYALITRSNFKAINYAANEKVKRWWPIVLRTIHGNLQTDANAMS